VYAMMVEHWYQAKDLKRCRELVAELRERAGLAAEPYLEATMLAEIDGETGARGGGGKAGSRREDAPATSPTEEEGYLHGADDDADGEFYMDEETGLRTRTNRSGGIQGGISNGEIIELKIAFKPTSTITRPQNTVNRDGVDVELKARGRHDPCVVPRAVPMVESMVALVLVDHLMMQYAQCNLLGRDDYSDLVQGNMKTLYDPAFIGGDGEGGDMSAKDMSAAFSED